MVASSTPLKKPETSAKTLTLTLFRNGSSESASELEKINQCLEAVYPVNLLPLIVGAAIIADPHFVNSPAPRARDLRRYFNLDAESVGGKSKVFCNFSGKHFITYFNVRQHLIV